MGTFMTKKFFALFVLAFLAFAMSACSSDEDSRRSKMPRRGGGSELPWNKPASWEGGLPGMGGIGTTPRF